MMLKFGFELEGFYAVSGISLPPKEYPTDGFPGLVELRTIGASGLLEAYANLLKESLKYPDVDFKTTEFIFSGRERAELRRRWEQKTAADIQNIYGKAPRLLGNRTLASLQINISNQTTSEYRDNEGKLHSAKYGLLDVPKIVRALDKEFADEISNARRQPGEYCIKEERRLEYRSLPNSVFEFNQGKARAFINRLKNVFGDVA